MNVDKNDNPEPHYGCRNPGCAEVTSYPADMLNMHPDGRIICEYCYDEEVGFDDVPTRWSDLPKFIPHNPLAWNPNMDEVIKVGVVLLRNEDGETYVCLWNDLYKNWIINCPQEWEAALEEEDWEFHNPIAWKVIEEFPRQTVQIDNVEERPFKAAAKEIRNNGDRK